MADPSRSDSWLPSAGELFDGWKIEASLGRGGMGAVFVATHEAKGLRAALKLLVGHGAAAAGVFARFRREVIVMGRLTHPNLVRILHEALGHEPPYFAMELVEGGDLETLLQRNGRPGLDAAHVARLGVQIAEGLEDAHAHGVLHRDVKPSNVLLTPDGDVKLADFGLAKVFDMTALTQAYSLTGTLLYMAPEVIRDGTETVKSDLYSLGITLFEAATGDVPYQSDALTDLLSGKALPPPPSGAIRNVALREVIERLASPDPARRPASAGEAAELLRAVGDGTSGVRTRARSTRPGSASRPVAGRTTIPASPGARSAELGWQRRALLIAALGGAAVLGAAGVWMRFTGGSASSLEPASAVSPAVVESAVTPSGIVEREPPHVAELIGLIERESVLRAAVTADDGSPDGWEADLLVVGSGSIEGAVLRFHEPDSKELSAPRVAVEAGDPLGPRREAIASVPERSGDGWSWRLDRGLLSDGRQRFLISTGRPRSETPPRVLLEISREGDLRSGAVPVARRDPGPLCGPRKQQAEDAMAEYLVGNFPKAVAIAREALREDPDCAEAHIVLSRVYKRVVESRSGTDTLVGVLGLLSFGKELDAIPSAELRLRSERHLDRVARGYPGWDRLWHQYTERYLLRGDAAGAMRAARWRAVLHDGNPDVWTDLAELELDLATRAGESGRGADFSAVRPEPVEGERRGGRSRARELLAVVSHAEHGSTMRSGDDPKRAEEALMRGRALALLGREGEARAAFLQALDHRETAQAARRALEGLGTGRR